MTNTIERIKSAIAATFEIPVETICDDSSNQTVEKWDSIGQINLVMALEQELGLNFTMEEIAELKDFAAICRVVERKMSEPRPI